MSELEVIDLSSVDQLSNRQRCIETVSQGLEEFERISHLETNDRPLFLAIFDRDEQIVGGLLGKLLRGWLRIDMLWVAEALRGLGYGTSLVQRVEAIAMAHGCHSAHLDTYSFQAPGFYLKLGYEVFGELNDYPAGFGYTLVYDSITSPKSALTITFRRKPNLGFL
jgi:ribosomal protein S18 acetylase RimI-like enzyme